MITPPILLRALSLDEPGAGIPHAGISKGGVGKPIVLSVQSYDVAAKTMRKPHVFSWFNKPADYVATSVAASVAIVAIVGGFFVIQVTYAYLGLAIVTGLVLGIADAWLYLGKRAGGLRFMTCIFWFAAAILLREQFLQKPHGWEGSVGMFQFMMLAGATAATVVQIKETLTHQKRSAKFPLPTPAIVTPTAGAPVAPPPGAAGR